MASFNKLNKLIFVSLGFLFSSIVQSATVSDFLNSPFTARNISALKRTTANELLAVVDWEAIDKKGLKKKVSRQVKFGKATVGKAILKRALSPWGVAVSAVISGAGYVIDAINNQIYDSSSNSTEIGACNFGSVGQSTLSECLAGVKAVYPNAIVSSQNNLDSYTEILIARDPTHTYIHWTWTYSDSVLPPDYYQTFSSSVLSDSDIADSFAPYFSDSELKKIFTDPVSSNPVLPGSSNGFDDVSADINNDYVAQYDSDPATNPTTSTQEQIINNTDTTYIDNGVTNNITNSEAKNICETNPDSLACMQVGKPPTDLKVQTYQVPFSVSKYSLFSNAQCPAPVSQTLKNGQTVSFSFKPLCDFARGIKPVVVALGLVIAYLIVGGVVRG